MRRREQREHVFKLMFMTEFNSEEEMTEQLSLYFEGLGELSEQDQEYMKKKYAHVKEHLEEIDAQLNSASRGWKTKDASGSFVNGVLGKIASEKDEKKNEEETADTEEKAAETPEENA